MLHKCETTLFYFGTKLILLRNIMLRKSINLLQACCTSYATSMLHTVQHDYLLSNYLSITYEIFLLSLFNRAEKVSAAPLKSMVYILIPPPRLCPLLWFWSRC